ncbi:non-ribosomal peptide synthetase [Calothrix sp. PCC 6303]|uniref:non-ribosomal peptide synthetase n=1 Tax=Calothrix sp. PCC 6303 TaxID=1170562 RepID=UPI0002A02B82|nr:non-ribosomal peptide synthetase [Calothrix sp. PCC 6303]AFZ01580.1 amino acid adenylation domain protein [Calothrix sp. PCC 6303]
MTLEVFQEPDFLNSTETEVYIFPASFGQKRLWFLDQLEPGSPFYNLPFAIRLSGDLNLAVLEQSFQIIIERHEALRSILTTVEGEPVQAIAPHLKLTISVVNLQNLPEDKREIQAQKLATEEARCPFVLSEFPLLRLKLIRLGEQEHILLLTIHHAIFDGWSIGILLKELAAIYTNLCDGQPASLPDLPLQYADYSVWQQEWLHKEVLKKQLAYWKQQLNGISTLQLPTDRPRSALQTFEGKTYTWQISPDLTTALERFSQKSGVTLFMTLLTAFNTLLYRYTGQDDIVVGSAIANRNWAESEGIIGLFVNTLALRTQIDDNPSFSELLTQVRDMTLAAYAHQDLPFEKLVEELQPERDLSRNPLFQVWFALHNLPIPTLQLGDLTLTPIEVETGTAQFDLSLDIYIGEQGLTGAIEYSSELFEAATIARMVEHFQTLLNGIVVNSQTKLSEVPLLTATEKQQLLIEWNQTQTAIVESQSLHEVFTQQVEKTPDAIAIIVGGESLTYQQLNHKANQLANYLQKLGVSSGTLVGISLEKSLEMIIGIFGILKAGGAYIPIDPTYPVERVALILKDAQLPILLTQQSLVDQLPAHDAEVICLDTNWEAIASGSSDYIHYSSSLAYIIYTSGSTGEPKGVCCQHLGVLNLLADIDRRQPLKAGDLCSLWTSFSFDVSVYEIFSALLFGATLYIVPEEIRSDSQGFFLWLRTHQITSAYIPPFMLPVLANYLEQSATNLPLRRLLVGVEPILEQTLTAISDRIPDLHIINGYGPTEATICTTLYSLPSQQKQQRYTPIGKPINNSQIYLLDSHLQPVPIGIPGEIYIGGINLAQGYLNRPELTNEKFILNPFETLKSTCLYKTGDIARYLADGNLEFIGRSDYQVKIRGFRIELGEIESVLQQHPSVQDTVVITREDLTNDKKIVAYVVPKSPNNHHFETEYISDLEILYDQFYSWQFSEQDPSINLRVWTSRYTNQPLPAAEIIECVENTVERILALQPQHVLEIGCGTGLILSRVAPHCQHYCGVDISATALEYLQQLLSQRQPELLSKVSLIQGIAHNLTEIQQKDFDVIILNEIIQNFPSIDYLVTVLEHAVSILKPGGRIFLGGVRSLQLLEAFHAGVQLYQAPSDLNLIDFKKRIQESLQAENELVISPKFFSNLQQDLPQISDVQIQLKGGCHHNELTQFKYDVILNLGQRNYQPESQIYLDWQQEKFLVADIQNLLQNQPQTLKISNISNARISKELKTLDLLKTADESTTIEQLKATLANISTTGIDPHEFWQIADLFGYTAKISWSENSQEGNYDVVFEKNISTNHQEEKHQQIASDTSLSPESWSIFANQPLQQKQELQLISQLRNFAQTKFPEYMLPQFFVILPSLPLTVNGKIDRKALPKPERTAIKGENKFTSPRSSNEEILAQIWTQVLGLEAVGIYDNFFELGGDSILSIQVVAQANQQGLQLTPKQIFQHQTIAELATVVGSNEAIEAEQGLVTGNVPLTPIQHWFFAQNFSQPEHYNQPNLLIVPANINSELLPQVIHELLIHHDVLRSQFTNTDSGWQQVNTQPNTEIPFIQIDLSTFSTKEQQSEITLIAEKLQSSLNLTTGSLVKVALFNLGKNQSSRLLFVIHHLLVDGVSWRILLEDFQTAYNQLSHKLTIQLPAKTTSYQHWAKSLLTYAQSSQLESELDYWLRQFPEKNTCLPVDFPQGINSVKSSAQICNSLDEAETQNLLHDLPSAYRTQINEILLTALAQTFTNWTGNNTLLIDLEGHGREPIFADIDLSRTVGWFTSIFPVCLNFGETNDIIQELKVVKEQLRQIPNQGIGYGLLRYLGREEIAQKLAKLPRPQVIFNYLGQFNQISQQPEFLTLAPESIGSEQSSQATRSHLLEINCFVVNNKLQIEWNYSQELYHSNTIQNLAQGFVEALRSLINHRQSADVGSYIPSDFSSAKIGQKDFNKLLAKLKPNSGN